MTPLLVNLHWLRVPECIQYKLCVLVHRCLNGTAPQYLHVRVDPAAVGRRLTSSTTFCIHGWSSGAGYTRRSTIGDRALAVAGPRAWTNLSVDLRPSLHFLLSKHTWSHICSTYHSLFFDFITDFLYRALEAVCAVYASLNLSLLHCIASPVNLAKYGKLHQCDNFELYLFCSVEVSFVVVLHITCLPTWQFTATKGINISYI